MRPEKTQIVSDIQSRLNQSPFLILVDYTGLNVPKFAELRSRLVKVGAKCQVVKNTFLKKAAAEAGLPDFSAELKGQSALVTGESDVCAAAKILKSFAAEFEKPAIRLGVLDGALLGKGEIHALADLPSREVLLAKLLGLLQAPAGQLVRLLNEPASRFARLLKAKAEQGNEAAAA